MDIQFLLASIRIELSLVMVSSRCNVRKFFFSGGNERFAIIVVHMELQHLNRQRGSEINIRHTYQHQVVTPCSDKTDLRRTGEQVREIVVSSLEPHSATALKAKSRLMKLQERKHTILQPSQLRVTSYRLHFDRFYPQSPTSNQKI